MNPPNRDDSTPADALTTTSQVRRAFKIHPGMNVYSSDRRKLGLVDRMYLEQGMVTGFVITHGLPQRRHKQMQFDSVDHLEDQTIILGLDQSAFLQMPDVDPNIV